jgi:hypothetical protein
MDLPAIIAAFDAGALVDTIGVVGGRAPWQAPA